MATSSCFDIKETKDDLSESAETLLMTSSGDLMRCLRHYMVSPVQCDVMVHQIDEWYSKQPHLPQGDLEKRFIIRHLITKSFSVERVKEKIDNYYTARNKMPELLRNRDPLSPNIDKILREGFWMVLPKRTPENYRITMLRIKKPGNFSVIDLIKVGFMIGDYRLRNDSAVGDHWILDFKHIAFNQAFQMNPVVISKVAFYLNSCLTPKLKGMHIVNMPPYAETILNLFKRSMKSKLVKRIHIYNNLEDVMNNFPRSIVPKDFGGDEICIDDITENWRKALQSTAWRLWFIAQDAVGADEALRVSQSDDGCGSFRMLEID